jgi:RNA polymerase sigma-70 factor (ECF subfamily)
MAEPTPADPDRQFEDAFDRHWLSVFRFALAWTNEWRSAEDITQDAFLRLWSNRARVDWSVPILPWLLTTARRLATDRFRRLRRVASLTPQAAAPINEDARVRWLDVQAAMKLLTPEQRAALVLTKVIGLDTATAAVAIGTTAGGVRASVSRARERLARE